MDLLIKNKNFSLQNIDEETGLGLVYSEEYQKCLFLDPLATALWNLSDPIDPCQAKKLAIEQIGAEITEDFFEETLSHMCEWGLLIPVSMAAQQKDPQPRYLVQEEKEPLLQHIYFYSTMECNARCYHCYQPTTKVADAAKFPNANQVSNDKFLKLAEAALPLGLQNVKITGGEPFLRRDTAELVQDLGGMGVHVSLETNGSLITDEIAAVLAKERITVAISLDGATEETHDTYRRLPGSYRKALNALRIISSKGGKPKVIISVSRRNLNELEDIIRVAKANGSGFVKINPVSTIGLGKKLKDTGYLLSIEEVLMLCHQRLELEKRHGVVVFMEVPPAFSSVAEIAMGRIGICPFTNIIGILEDGSISFCGIGNTHPELILGNINDNNFSLEQFWGESQGLVDVRHLLRQDLQGVCSICVHKPYCKGSCRALAFDEFGSFIAPHAWCQKAYDKGLFPVQYLIQKREQNLSGEIF